jgi:hypothetical protein
LCPTIIYAKQSLTQIDFFNYDKLLYTKQVPVQISVPTWFFDELQATARRDMTSISTTGRKALAKGLGVLTGGRPTDERRKDAEHCSRPTHERARASVLPQPALSHEACRVGGQRAARLLHPGLPCCVLSASVRRLREGASSRAGQSEDL